MIISITLIKSKTFADKIISLGMWLWARLRKLPQSKTFGHLEIGYGEYSIGAVSQGVIKKDRKEYLSKHASDYMSFDIVLNRREESMFYDYLEECSSTKYEFENFFWHLIKIITGRWCGSKTSKETYCFEFGLTFMKKIGYDVDVYMNPYEAKLWLNNNLK